MFCRECGAKLPDGSKFCSECGTKVIIEGSVQAQPQVAQVQPVQVQSQVTNVYSSINEQVLIHSKCVKKVGAINLFAGIFLLALGSYGITLVPEGNELYGTYSFSIILGILNIVSSFIVRKARNSEIFVTENRVYGTDNRGKAYNIFIRDVRDISFLQGFKAKNGIKMNTTTGEIVVDPIENPEQVAATINRLNGRA
ncbi:MAG: zinc ribbon domain-containing protein [Lachnospiraceae bacterium]|nr:zinc ribbon domain-containing protein [Lachnospiraceae bacterium]